MANQLILDQFEELKSKYTKLELVHIEGSYKVLGCLAFTAILDKTELKDEFKIEITIPQKYPEKLPTVKETGNRIPADFHQFSDRTLCLGAPLALKKNFQNQPTLIHFVESLLIPYFYSFLHFSELGAMPYGELAHGQEGIIQYFKELFFVDDESSVLGLLDILSNWTYKGHRLCPCQSGKKLRHCHGPLLIDLNNLQLSQNFQDAKKESEDWLIERGKLQEQKKRYMRELAKSISQKLY